MKAEGGRGRDTWLAAASYLALALYATWPLALGLSRDVPWDLGDSLLNMWILGWDVEQLKGLGAGDFTRITRFFDANIFYPAPLTLAYSEHLVPQALQILPVYLLTNNPILAYNVLFLSTFVLSGVGAYLLVRELTGNWQAAFLGGLLFGFALYRSPQLTHLQTLSSQWMPFALYGLVRYFDSRNRRALAGGTAALVLQGLSSGYYLLYFTPFAAAFALWEIARRGLWRERRIWIDLGVAGGATALLVAPFLVPYSRVHATLEMARSADETARFSADVYSYFTALSTQRIWGSAMQLFPRPEGELFPGAVSLALGIGALGAWGMTAWRAGREVPARTGGLLATLLGSVALVSLALAVVAIFERRLTIPLPFVTISVTSIGRVLLLMIVSAAIAVAVSPRARTRARALLTIEGFFCIGIVTAWWLSLGPRPRGLGRPLDLPAPYAFLYDLVPGFDGLRVPARFAMVGALMLAVAAALFAARLLRGRRGVALLAAISALFIVEATVTTFTLNGQDPATVRPLPEARVYRPARAPALYRRVATLPRDTVLLELPIGDTAWDLRAVYYSTAHWRRIVNGYSGFFPPGYGLISLALVEPTRHEAVATSVLRASGATHVLVHGSAFTEAEAAQIAAWLARTGREIARDGDDALYEVAR